MIKMERIIVKERDLDILIYSVGNNYEAHAANTKTGQLSIARGVEKWSTITEGIERVLRPMKS